MVLRNDERIRVIICWVWEDRSAGAEINPRIILTREVLSKDLGIAKMCHVLFDNSYSI